jgi:zinc and cadmium transporter
MTLSLILAATLLVSIISLVGILTLTLKEKILKDLIFCFVGFAAGALLAGAFLHLIPQALKRVSQSETVFLYLILGFILFFLLEKYLYWRHCHNGICKLHTFTYLNLFGDGLHNFIDGVVIAVAFNSSVKLGFATTMAVILHEIPQELSDFGVLVYGGFTKGRALFYNFLFGLTAVAGGLAGYFLTLQAINLVPVLLALTAGGFIYIASSDLIPELHRHPDTRHSLSAFISFLSGLGFMFLIKHHG